MRRTTFGHFFLTSKPYFGLDSDNFLQADFDILSGRLTIQPSDFGYITANATINFLDIFGGGESFNVYPEHNIRGAAELNIIDIFGGGVEYEVEAEYITAIASIHQLDIFGGGVEYDIEHHDMKATAILQAIDVYT